MARIADSDIDRLKAEVSVAGLMEAAGITLERVGNNLSARCPFHEDSTSSLVVEPDKNVFHCVGCGVEGGPVEWVMKKSGVSFRHAALLLREGVPGVTSETVKRSTLRALPLPVSPDADDQALLDQVIDYYHETLKRSPEALAYLKARGLANSALIDTFRIGYANRTLGLRLPHKQRKDGADIRARLERIGIYRESGHEHFNGSLTVPVLDAEGHTRDIYGRKIHDNLRPSTPKHLFLPGPPKGAWNLAGIAQCGGEIVLTGTLMDAMTFWCAGFRNVTSAYGVEGLTTDHLAAFKAHGIKRVLIAFDRSDASESGVAKIVGKLIAEGIDCYRVQFPKGLDANTYALRMTPASKSLGVLIRRAEWIGNGVAPSAPTTATGGLPAEVSRVATPSPVSLAKGVGPMQPAEPAFEHIVPVVVVDVDNVDDTFSSSAASGQSDVLDDDAMSDDDLVQPVAPLPASVMPEAMTAEPEAQIGTHDITLAFGPRRYRVRGFAKNLAVDVMKVNLLASSGENFHVDTFDLYSARHRANFIQMAAGELRLKSEVVKSDLGRVLLKLEAMQDEQIRKALTPDPGVREIAIAEREAALAFLKLPDLLTRILADFEVCGLVGESNNKLVAYLAAVSRKLASPLAVVVQSSSAAGKTSLMDAVLAFVPEEDRVRYSALTGQALFYMGAGSLKHRILALAEEEGASRATYALKLLQSDGELAIASTAKDPETGKLVTQEYRVEGPVMLCLTTAAITIDEELMNRCLVLGVDEGRAQTEAIHRLQRKRRTLEGLIAKSAKDELLKLHRNAQRLLRPLAIVNPYADRLSFLSDKTRARRDHEKYLTLIDSIALLYQHQRAVKRVATNDSDIEYVEVTLADIEAANRLAHEVLGRSIDELPPQTRGVLASVKVLVEERAAALNRHPSEIRFSRRELREAAGFSDTQLKVHLARLVELEYLIVHRAERGRGHVYELIYDGDGTDAPHLSGLIDPRTLAASPYDGHQSGANVERPGSGRPSVGSLPEGGRSAPVVQTPSVSMPSPGLNTNSAKPHVLETKNTFASYRNTSSHQSAVLSSDGRSPTVAEFSFLAASFLSAGR